MWLSRDEHVEDDAITMRSALRLSSNRAAVRMLGRSASPPWSTTPGASASETCQCSLLAIGTGLTLVSDIGVQPSRMRVCSPSEADSPRNCERREGTRVAGGIRICRKLQRRFC
jgi:hypothetical protein